MQNMKIGILTAMSNEYAQLAALLEEKAEIKSGPFTYLIGHTGKNDIILRQSGIGKVNAAIATAELIKAFNPQCIISTGVAGGIDSSLKIMDVVVSQQICYHDVWCGMGCQYGQIQGMPVFFNGNPRLIETALRLNDIQSLTTIHAGLICTGDQFIQKADEQKNIKNHFPAGLACDMESAAIAHTCYLYEMPFVSFRIISDTPGATDNHNQQWDDFWAEMANRSFLITKYFLEELRVTCKTLC